jgi:biotin carboxyl carrier protein
MIVSPMYGKIVKINVKEKDTISQGDIVLVIDSMKIENNILAPRMAKVTRVLMNPGDQVELNKPIIAIE